MHFQNRMQPSLQTEPQSKQENFDIFLRLKPSFSNQPQQVLTQVSDNKVEIVSPYYHETEKTFIFDKVFPTDTSNQQLFASCIQNPITNLISGFNATVLIYGATGAGKTYTMFGNGDQNGIVYLALKTIFEKMRSDTATKYRLSLSFYEIYNQTIRDLLQQQSSPLNILQDPNRGTIINQLSQHELENEQDALCFLQEGIQHRAMNATNSNEVSSRSHAIFQLTLKQYTNSSRNQKCRMTESKLFLIDLAGNEKSSSNCSNMDKRFVEGVNINKSLLTLGKCINILAQKKNQFVPFRDSKLTRILKQSLGGNSKTVMLACVSMQKHSYEQTLNTLKYTSLAKNIKNKRVKITRQVDKSSIAIDPNILRTFRGSDNNSSLAEAINGLSRSIQEKVNTMSILNNLAIAKKMNQEQYQKSKSSSISESIGQINRFSSQIKFHHEDALNKVQYFQKLIYDSVSSRNKQNQTKSVNDQYKAALKQIQMLKSEIKEKDKKIAQLERTPTTHMTSIGSQPSGVQIQLSKSINKSNIKINPMQKKSLLQLDVKSSLNIQKQNVSGASKVFNKKSKEIVIDLNSKSSKQQFVEGLKTAQKIADRNIKDPKNSKQIQRLISLQELHQFQLNNVEQSIFRKLKFLQQKRIDHQSSSSESRLAFRGLSVGRNK